ncbi:hypothetical protein Q9L58_010025 [Maublancomyces gigas]|uniref:Uncharacterized protein n=1 Tax=Discina gigas TaxID=1032678 RepID=A0ABR3G6C5_9PEZI
MYVEHTGKHRISVPFLAYNDSYHREVEQFQNSWHRRTKEQTQYNISGNIVTVHPFDISILLAMAQVQETMLPPQEEYRVFLLYPNIVGTHVHLLAAKVSAGYLQCLRDPCLPPLCDSLTIAHSSVPISETRHELEYLVRRILASAPTLPPPPGVGQDIIQSNESTRQSAKRRHDDRPQNERGNTQRPTVQQPAVWKRIKLEHLKELGIHSGGPAGSENQA